MSSAKESSIKHFTKDMFLWFYTIPQTGSGRTNKIHGPYTNSASDLRLMCTALLGEADGDPAAHAEVENLINSGIHKRVMKLTKVMGKTSEMFRFHTVVHESFVVAHSIHMLKPDQEKYLYTRREMILFDDVSADTVIKEMDQYIHSGGAKFLFCEHMTFLSLSPAIWSASEKTQAFECRTIWKARKLYHGVLVWMEVDDKDLVKTLVTVTKVRVTPNERRDVYDLQDGTELVEW